MNSSEEPKPEQTANTGEASKATEAPMAKVHVAKNEAVPPQPNTAKAESVAPKTKDHSVNHVTEEVKKEASVKEEATTVKTVAKEHHEVKAKDEKRAEQEHKHNDKPKDDKEVKIKDHRDPKAKSAKEEKHNEKDAAKPTVEKQKVIAKAAILKAAEETTGSTSTTAPTIRLKNTVFNCLEVRVPKLSRDFRTARILGESR